MRNNRSLLTSNTLRVKDEKVKGIPTLNMQKKIKKSLLYTECKRDKEISMLNFSLSYKN